MAVTGPGTWTYIEDDKYRCILTIISSTSLHDTEDTDIEEFEEEVEEEVHHWQPLNSWVVEDQRIVVEQIGNQEHYLTHAVILLNQWLYDYDISEIKVHNN